MRRKLIKCPDTGEAVWSYKAYLHTEHWALFREQYFLRNDRRCKGCGTVDGPIHLHHLTYARVGCEQDTDVTPMCKRCHEIVEHEKRGIKPKKKMTREERQDARDRKRSKKRMDRSAKRQARWTRR